MAKTSAKQLVAIYGMTPDGKSEKLVTAARYELEKDEQFLSIEQNLVGLDVEASRLLAAIRVELRFRGR